MYLPMELSYLGFGVEGNSHTAQSHFMGLAVLPECGLIPIHIPLISFVNVIYQFSC